MMSEQFNDKRGNLYFCVKGKYHREDGPAIITPTGKEFYYLEGKRYMSYEEFRQAVIARRGSKIDSLLDLF